jgi:C4-dicarboxylate transporter, DctM subunit
MSAPRPTPVVVALRAIDDGLFRIEQWLISLFLIAMTGMVFLDVIHRRLTAPDSRIGRLLASPWDYASDSPERLWIDSNVAPWVGGIVGILLVYAGARAAERNQGRPLFGMKNGPVVVAAAVVTSAVALGALVVSFESWIVYLILYAVCVGGWTIHLLRTRPDGWKGQMMAVLVLTPAFVFVALNYFPEAFTWAKELAMLMVLWVGFSGASICVHEGKHIRLEALERTHPEKLRPWLRLLGNLGAASLSFLFAWLGYSYVFDADTGTYSLGMTLQETGLPDWVMTISIPVAFSMSGVRFVAAGLSGMLGGNYGAPAKAEGMEEAEKLAAEKSAEEGTSAAVVAPPVESPEAHTPAPVEAHERAAVEEPLPEPEKDARGAPIPHVPSPPPRPWIFVTVLLAIVIAPLAFGSGGILFAAILAAVLLGQPLFVVLGVVTILCFVLWGGVDQVGELSILVERMRTLADNKALLSVPFYVMSGAVMGYGQIGRRLVDFSNALFGWLPGGLAISVVFGCILFSAISGSSPATVIAIGSVMGPALIAHGYRKDFSLGLVTAAGSLGILIPPSIPMIVYCIVNTTTVMSVEEFHAAGFMPGFVIGGVLAVYCIYEGIRSKAPRDPFSLQKLWIAVRDGIWSLLFPVLILGGIYLGFFDDIEAACTSVVYALTIEIFVHRAFGIRDVPKVFMEVGVLLGSFLVVLVIAMSFGEFLEEASIPAMAAARIEGMNLEPWQFLLVLNLLLLVVGCFMDIMSAMFVFVPLLAPMAAALGINPIHLGIIFIVNLEIGYLLPPMGLNLYVSATLFREPIGFITRSVVPFILTMIVGLMVITYVPSLTLDSAAWVMSLTHEETERDRVVRDREGGDVEHETGSRPDGVMTMEEMMGELEAEDEEADGHVRTMEEMMRELEAEDAEAAEGTEVEADAGLPTEPPALGETPSPAP